MEADQGDNQGSVDDGVVRSGEPVSSSVGADHQWPSGPEDRMSCSPDSVAVVSEQASSPEVIYDDVPSETLLSPVEGVWACVCVCVSVCVGLCWCITVCLNKMLHCQVSSQEI